MRMSSTLTALVLGIAGCGSDGMDHGTSADKVPAAPTELTATALSGGAHLTWKDNSDDEEHFMVLRRETGVEQDYKTITTLPFDTIQHHDGPLTTGSTYMYKVVAMNGAGEAASNEVMVTLQ
ncbi:MAG TPA: fibronectin type III domain-containing protein [Polyangiaceae bacterium]|nr:fibronectin type III domain-containing protein [Polyangiaceae bacterium]